VELPWEPVSRYLRRKSARALFRKPQVIRLSAPLISFSFDDFPRSALLTGGEILKQYNVLGTYYSALGLLGRNSVSGPIATGEDLQRCLGEGHELGCHTFSHLDSWKTPARVFDDSLIQNSDALNDLIPGARFRSFSYPMSEPHPLVKRAASRHFLCCRSGGQKLNSGTADLNQLSAYFLEKANGNVEPIKNLIDKNTQLRGWIIFGSHDISSQPSPYGCTPEFFAKIVRYAVDSGARILPVAEALNVVCGLEGSLSGSYGAGTATPVRPAATVGPPSE
jgi:peptidoglycan/xylan/chitin deacetylase (PgdA/CDA1 family)